MKITIPENLQGKLNNIEEMRNIYEHNPHLDQIMSTETD